MVKRGHFDITAVDSMRQVAGAQENRELKERLRLLHCVNFGDMPPELLDALPGMIQDYLGGPVIDIEDWLRPKRQPAPAARVIDITPAPRRGWLAGLLK